MLLLGWADLAAQSTSVSDAFEEAFPNQKIDVTLIQLQLIGEELVGYLGEYEPQPGTESPFPEVGGQIDLDVGGQRFSAKLSEKRLESWRLTSLRQLKIALDNAKLYSASGKQLTPANYRFLYGNNPVTTVMVDDALKTIRHFGDLLNPESLLLEYSDPGPEKRGSSEPSQLGPKVVTDSDKDIPQETLEKIKKLLVAPKESLEDYVRRLAKGDFVTDDEVKGWLEGEPLVLALDFSVTRYRREVRTQTVTYTEMRTETRTRTVNVTKNRTESRTRMVPERRTRTEQRRRNVAKEGMPPKWESYTVDVSYTENVPQEYTVQVPYTEQIPQEYTVQVPVTSQRQMTVPVVVPWTDTISRKLKIPARRNADELAFDNFAGELKKLAGELTPSGTAAGPERDPKRMDVVLQSTKSFWPAIKTTIARKQVVEEIDEIANAPDWKSSVDTEYRTYNYTVAVPYVEQQEQIYTIKVPVQKTIQSDGVTKTITVYQTQTRTRTVNVQKTRLETRTGQYRFPRIVGGWDQGTNLRRVVGSIPAQTYGNSESLDYFTFQRLRYETRTEQYTVQVPEQYTEQVLIGDRMTNQKRTVYRSETRTRDYVVEVPITVQALFPRHTSTSGHVWGKSTEQLIECLARSNGATEAQGFVLSALTLPTRYENVFNKNCLFVLGRFSESAPLLKKILNRESTAYSMGFATDDGFLFKHFVENQWTFFPHAGEPKNLALAESDDAAILSDEVGPRFKFESLEKNIRNGEGEQRKQILIYRNEEWKPANFAAVSSEFLFRLGNPLNPLVVLSGQNSYRFSKHQESLRRRAVEFLADIADEKSGFLVIGRVTVDKNDRPDFVSSQMQIEKDGTFITVVRDLKLPLTLRMHQYTPLDIKLAQPTNSILDVGFVRLKRVAKNKLLKFKAKFTFDHRANQRAISNAKIEVSAKSGPTNNFSNGYEMRRARPKPITDRLSKNGSIELNGFSPMKYHLSVKSEGYITLSRTLDFTKGHVDLGTINLEPKE